MRGKGRDERVGRGRGHGTGGEGRGKDGSERMGFRGGGERGVTAGWDMGDLLFLGLGYWRSGKGVLAT